MAEDFNITSELKSSENKPDAKITGNEPTDLAGSLSELLRQYSGWDEKQSSLFETQFQIIERLDDLSNKIDALASNGFATDPSSRLDGESAKDTSWENQKSRVLEDHGVSSVSDSPTLKPVDEDCSPDTIVPPPKKQAPEYQAEAEEPDEILELRGHLEQKLRESEIEISIERAKLARIQQELDEHRTEMERDFARQTEELAQCRKKNRWKRFFPRKRD